MKILFVWYVRTPLVVLNIAAFVLGCVGGLLVWKLGASGYSVASDGIISVLQPFGNVLIFMLKMIVVPIILCSLVCGAASLPFHQFGKMGMAVTVRTSPSGSSPADFICDMPGFADSETAWKAPSNAAS